MPLEQLLLLALIQGLAEFLPISSSAHLILLPALTAFADQGVLIDVALHVGSLGAVIVYFRREVFEMIWAVPDLLHRNMTPEARLLAYLIVATIPALGLGAIFAFYGITDLLRNKTLVAWTLIGYGLLLAAADHFGPREREIKHLTVKDIIFIGLAQALALIPGTSRSGITMTAGRFLGLHRVAAARFSMLLSIPVILASGAFATLSLATAETNTSFGQAMLAVVFSFVVALTTIWIFLKVLDRIGFLPFVLYRVLLGIALLTVL